MWPRVRALVLDAGNTLVFLDHARVADVIGGATTEQALRAAEAQAKRRYQALLAAGGGHEQGFPLYFRALFEEAGLSPATSLSLVPLIERAHLDANLFSRVPEGTAESLDRARAGGMRVGVVSNSEGTLAALLDRVGLGSRLEFVLDSALEGVRKPDPEIFRRALRRLDLPADETIYAGDIPDVDVSGARSAGMHAVLVDPFDHFPDYTAAPRVASVVELVERLLA